MATVHIIGAGLAGLSCAVALGRAGLPVRLYEAAPQAGGRCRSYHDSALDHVIDNGNHLLLAANRATIAFLETIGAADRLTGPARAVIPFLDLETLTPWSIDFGSGRLPWWILQPSRRVPGTGILDYLALGAILRPSGAARLGERIPLRGAVFDRFLEPMIVAVMNEAPQHAAVAPFAAVLRETLLAGGAACRPLVARESLAETFIEPALAFLRRCGAEIRFGQRARAFAPEGDRIRCIHFTAETVTLADDDRLVLAVPPAVAQDLVPGLVVPRGDSPIVNLHFRTRTTGLDRWFGDAPLLGLVNGVAQWVFRRDGLLSVTVSAAEAMIDEPTPILAALVWEDLARAFGLSSRPLPPYRVVKEKRATFRQTPENEQRRPPAQTAFTNLLLAGDWTATGLPATIEGAVRSGNTAAAAVLRGQRVVVPSAAA
jgi:squalene-associated FAD-dependent desaturase